MSRYIEMVFGMSHSGGGSAGFIFRVGIPAPELVLLRAMEDHEMIWERKEERLGNNGKDENMESGLGRDFWLYRIGHFISALGDSCTVVAVGWWVLDHTGSAAFMSTVLTAGMLTRLILLPLLSPLGDRLSRKGLMLAGYVLSAAAVTGFAFLARLDFFSAKLVVALNVFWAMGVVVFGVGTAGMTAKLVPADRFQAGMRVWEALGAIGFIAGGILGGIVVSTIKCSGAFAVDVAGFMIAFALVSAIKADTRPVRGDAPVEGGLLRHLATWASDLKEGFVVLVRVRFILKMVAVFIVMNLAVAPLPVIIPYYVKEVLHLPAWNVGLLDSALGVGILFGSLLLGSTQRHFRRDAIAIGGLCLVGGGLALFAVPGIAFPCVGMLTVGIGSTFFNICMNSNLTLAIPDHFRTRLLALLALVCQLARPMGLSLAGFVIERVPVPVFACAVGAVIVILAPVPALGREFRSFLRMDSKEVEGYFARRYGLGTDESA